MDRCLRKDVNCVLFLGSIEECRYLEKRIKNVFSLNASILSTGFMRNHAPLTNFIKVSNSADNQNEPSQRISNTDLYQYLEAIHVSIAGIMPRTTMADSLDRQINAGALFLDNNRVLYYPLEGNKFFVLSEDGGILKIDRLQNFRRGDYLLWVPELQQVIKRIIQEALQVFNPNAYTIIYEWRSFLERLSNLYGGAGQLATVFVDKKLTRQSVSQLKMNLQRWLDPDSDTWMPVDENIYMIYRLSVESGFCSESDMSARINLAKSYMLEASKIRVLVRNEIKNELEKHLLPIANGNSFLISIQGHKLRVFPYKVYDNNAQGILIDSSQVYRVITITE
jgi:hypothetical protein